jgi:regulatory protein
MKTRNVLEKMKSFCVYQERSEHEVERKLNAMRVDTEEIPEIIEMLKSENYLNEQRFVELFVRSKVNQKRWGEKKIRMALAHHQIDLPLINREIEKIDSDQYHENLEHIAEKKYLQLKDFPADKRLYRLKSYLYMLGYEMQLIDKVIENYERA